MAHLWLVRHARVLAPPGICYGRLDLPADHQATLASARALATTLPAGLTVSCSTLQRCEQLAHAVVALRPDLTLKMDARLCEIDFGDWEGQPWHAIDKHEIDAWAENLAHAAPGGGESLALMLERVARALHEAGLAAESGQASERTPVTRDVVWIAHAGVARCVEWLLGPGAALGRLPAASEWPAKAPPPGEWVCYPLAKLEAFSTS